LIRLSGWTGHHQGNEAGATMLDSADLLGQALHRGIEQSWRKDRRPSLRRRRKIQKLAEKLRSASGMPGPRPDCEEQPPDEGPDHPLQ
jgi:hypothetical protein